VALWEGWHMIDGMSYHPRPTYERWGEGHVPQKYTSPLHVPQKYTVWGCDLGSNTQWQCLLSWCFTSSNTLGWLGFCFYASVHLCCAKYIKVVLLRGGKWFHKYSMVGLFFICLRWHFWHAGFSRGFWDLDPDLNKWWVPSSPSEARFKGRRCCPPSRNPPITTKDKDPDNQQYKCNTPIITNLQQ
jgi:hypothetical protein